MEGLERLYSQEQVREAIIESRRLLKNYRQLKALKKIKFPNLKSPTFSDIPRGGKGTIDSHLTDYIEVISQLEQIEKSVARCELLQSSILRKKYLDETTYPQWKLAEMSGYSISRYSDYLNSSLLQFASAYGLI
ncbi:MAG: hypothetical protein L0F95_08250 [Lactococcus sp.]|jgi:ArpU family phage transcriptional regulator|uniref:Phage transcriptional regulator, ArpU family n=1 Tax=Pseudolactococcus piscium MKFS47 TaxID=297352 RepID=A0A0D6DZC3_9LACT|nr:MULTISPECIES: hypothetical protein [Lactococcus]MDN5409291.1 hypothetical protein [Lactococcus sp.]MDN5412378.1 hypothetical protein [Lactococcus sp.]MDN5437231.1 hypothetical protein [Lactococcus sp.]MDN5461005.1 hypothetical protein [Lactococcus sp.]MDN5467041.1 hypothetical protein [Lactococcus sp.]